MTEFTGYIATFLVMLSFMMKDVTRLRIINTIGCATWIAYGVMLDSYPVIITNVGILAINGGHLKFIEAIRMDMLKQCVKIVESYSTKTFKQIQRYQYNY
jgi:hypothetical protein